jgi:hypothetical protein
MNEFPFTTADWDRVKVAALAIVNAGFAEDRILADSLFFELQSTLHDLRKTYGAHPALLETEADFCPEIDDSIQLYSQAITISQANNLPMDSICISYARLLIESKRDLQQARELLELCQESVQSSSDRSALVEHKELLARLSEIGESSSSECG